MLVTASDFPQQKQAFGSQWQDSDTMKNQRLASQQQLTLTGSQSAPLPARQQSKLFSTTMQRIERRISDQAQQWTPTWISESPLEMSPSQSKDARIKTSTSPPCLSKKDHHPPCAWTISNKVSRSTSSKTHNSLSPLLDQMQDMSVPTNQRFVPQQQQQNFVETTTMGQNVVRLQGMRTHAPQLVMHLLSISRLRQLEHSRTRTRPTNDGYHPTEAEYRPTHELAIQPGLRLSTQTMAR